MSAWVTASQRILGMNARNLRYIRPHNTHAAVLLARNKLATKERLVANHLPTAAPFGVIRSRQELQNFDWSALPTSFVLKPNFGLGGNGILVIYGKTRAGQYIAGGDELYTVEDLKIRVSNILDGNYSISNIPDVAYFEQRLRLAEQFKDISYKGIPDIRVIVFNSVPVMAMLRLPTKASAGKANLHIGGIGVGIDLASGTTTYAINNTGKFITRHPDFNTALTGIQLPDWDNILRISIAAQQAIGLGYVGVDIVLDKELGPVILEVNGHPGLSIQNANRTPLRERLERVAGLNITSVSKGLSVCKELFAAEERIERDWPILGVFENVMIKTPLGTNETVRARLDTSLVSTTVSKTLAQRLGFTGALQALEKIALPQNIPDNSVQETENNYREQLIGIHPDIVDIVAVRAGSSYTIRPKVSLTFTLGGKIITSHVAIALDNKLSHQFLIGRNDLKDVLINPSKTKPL